MNIVEVGDNARRKKEFLMLPVRLYQNDSCWIRPLDNDIESVFDPEKNKYFSHGECTRWLLQSADGQTIGRVAAFIDRNTAFTYDQPTGGMGFFECIDDAKAAGIKTLLEKGLAYESGGSVYFDVLRYNENHHYGILSGRVIEDLLSETRELDGQAEKRNSLDFALWKKASPEHIMRWPSPWGMGFPGWHIECTSMSAKYLGEQFDIHGGGMDLKFPHHECEIAQAVGINGVSPVRYWMHTNMLTVNGEKMSKSKGNSFLPAELFAGSHPLLSQAYSPMTVRFFMLQAHYRSTLDFSNEALQSAQRAYRRLMNGLRIVKGLTYQADESVAPDEKTQAEIMQLCEACYKGMDDDLNTAVVIANLFNLLKKINSFYTGSLKSAAISEEVFDLLQSTFVTFIEEILGLKEEKNADTDGLIASLLDIYREAKAEKAYDKVDRIRSYFKTQGLVIKDMKTGIDWAYEEG